MQTASATNVSQASVDLDRTKRFGKSVNSVTSSEMGELESRCVHMHTVCQDLCGGQRQDTDPGLEAARAYIVEWVCISAE